MADYIVSTWDDFLRYNDSANTVKFANPHEVNGEIILQGNGTQGNPYIVSTYEEMLFATKATYIWQVKLIDREQKLYRYRYVSDYDEQRNPIYSEIFCKYDDSLSTIDFNDIAPEGYNASLEIRPIVIGNGWTWKNIVLNENGYIIFQISSRPVSQLIISNLYAKGSYCIQTNGGFKDSILDLFCESVNLMTVFTTATNGGVVFKNMSINLKARGREVSINKEEYYYVVLKNCRLNLDVDTTKFTIGYFKSWPYGTELNNVIITGDIKTSINNEDVQLGRSIRSCIYDVSYSGNSRLEIDDIVSTTSFYNSDKVKDETGLAVKNMYGATTEELKSAQYLFNKGFPIGVD